VTPFRVALLVTLALLLAYFPARETAFVQTVEGQLLDLRFALRPQAPPPDEIVLVVIDDRSIREVGRWPWSRSVIAGLVRALSDAGARAVGIDLLFLEPEVAGPSAQASRDLRTALRPFAARGEAVPAELLAELLADLKAPAPADRELADAVAASGEVVIPFSFGFAPAEQDGAARPPPFVEAVAVRITRTTVTGAGAPRAETLMPPIAPIGKAAAGLGHANIGLDAGGAARFEYPVVAYRDAYYPSFSLELARHYLGLARDRIGMQLGRGVQLGERFLPTDETMRLVVDYGRPGRFRRVSAADLLDGRVPAATFDDRLILIGGAAAGVGGTFISPFATSMPGIVRHANVLDNMLRESVVVRRDLLAVAGVAFLLVAGPALGWIGARRGGVAISAVFALLLAALLAGNLFTFVQHGLWLDLFLPLIGLVLVYATVIGHTYLVGMREQRLLRNAFRHYLAPALVDQVAREPSLLRLGGEEKELTVLFADVRNSTALGARLPPAEFVQLLNACFDAMTREIFARGGMLDKFMGDGLLAVFGAPLPQPDHAERACRAALAMQDAVGPLRERWRRPELPEVDLGIGINTGPMIIGNMGSAERFDYTVIGDEANLGARLEAANKELGTRILISEATYRQVEGRIKARELDVIRFRGMARAVRVFELLGEAPRADGAPARGRAETRRPAPPR